MYCCKFKQAIIWGSRNGLIHFTLIPIGKIISVYEHFGLRTFRFTNIFVYEHFCFEHFGLRTFRFTNISVYEHFGLRTFRFTNISVYKHFGLRTFRFTTISVYKHFGLRTFLFTNISVYQRTSGTNQVLEPRFDSISIGRVGQTITGLIKSCSIL